MAWEQRLPSARFVAAFLRVRLALQVNCQLPQTLSERKKVGHCIQWRSYHLLGHPLSMFSQNSSIALWSTIQPNKLGTKMNISNYTYFTIRLVINWNYCSMTSKTKSWCGGIPFLTDPRGWTVVDNIKVHCSVKHRKGEGEIYKNLQRVCFHINTHTVVTNDGCIFLVCVLCVNRINFHKIILFVINFVCSKSYPFKYVPQNFAAYRF